jgi:hypothetical protein
MPADTAPIVVRAYQPGDESAILDLFARSFHVPRTREHWQWKYVADPYGREHISLAFDGSRLAGHYAGYPVPFICDGAESVAHQIGDTMTDPAVRHIGRGPSSILGRCAAHFYENFCDGKVAFNYGFNVANIQKFSTRFLRADRVLSVSYRVRRGRMAAPARLSRWLRGYRLEIVTAVDSSFDDLFARAVSEYQFLIRRDAQYLRWRYFECPDTRYIVVAIRKRKALAGWIVYRIRENRLVWGDALFDPAHPDAVSIAVRHVAAAHGVDMVEGWFPRHPRWFDAQLARMGFEHAPEPQDLALMCVPFTIADATDRMRRSLYYTMGDSDLF